MDWGQDELELVVGRVTPARLRALGARFCERLRSIWPDPLLDRLLRFGLDRERLRGSAEADSLARDARAAYGRLYPGYGSFSAAAMALSAAGDLAFTESAVKAVVNAGNFAAGAVAVRAAEGAADADHDRVFEAAYRREREAQLAIVVEFAGS